MIGKQRIVIALHKKGSKSNVNNYWPVSLTSVVCKVFRSNLSRQNNGIF